MRKSYDVIIIGTGLGGGTLVSELAKTGAEILLIERGDFIPSEPENWDAAAVFRDHRYTTVETWNQHKLKFFYCVGGASKVYGAALQRFRQEDFDEVAHFEGVSPAWPFRYQDLEPYYTKAEQLYGVHGSVGADPTDPPRSAPFPFPALNHEPAVQRLHDRLVKHGLSPFPLPEAVDLHDYGKCIRCATCDGYPCKLGAKGDADVCCVRPSLQKSNVEILPRTLAIRLITNENGNLVRSVEVEKDGERFELSARRFVISCGAIHSALLLLRSASNRHPNGLANSSGMVGRNFMAHNGGLLVAFDLWHRNLDLFQKTLGINDFYFKNHVWDYPMGNVQLWGKVSPHLVKSMVPVLPTWKVKAALSRSIVMQALTEDLPDPENRVVLDSSGKPQLLWKPNNLTALEKLMRTMKEILQKAGYAKVVASTAYTKDQTAIPAIAHQCGTVRAGTDPKTSVLDSYCRSHDIENLFVVDSSFFPSSAALNPGLTIIAQALRVGSHMSSELK